MLRSKNNNLIWNGSGPRLETGRPVIGYEVQELNENVEILIELQHQQRDLEAEIGLRKTDLLAIVSQRGPLKAHGQLLRQAVRTRKVLDTDRLGQFLQGYGQSLADFQKSSTYSFLEIRKAA